MTAATQPSADATIRLSATQRAFVRDQHRYVLFLGGVGAGKTYAGAVRALHRFASESRPSLGLVVAPCYDDQTEVLTERRGWQFFRNLAADDRVATLRDAEFLEYQLPRQTFDYPYSGEMIHLRSQEIDLAMTPNHRCWTRFKTWDWQIKTADELYGKWDWKFKKTVIWQNDLPVTEEAVTYFEYLGFWFAEGSAQHDDAKRRWRVTVTQKKYVEYAEELVAVAAGQGWASRWPSMSARYRKEPRTGGGFNFTINNKAMAAQFVQYGKAHTKAVPQWIKDAPVGHLRAFLRGFIKGDGHEKSGTHDQTQMWTMSKQLADDLQEIAFKAGFSANVAKHKQGYYLCIRQRAKEEPGTKRGHWSKTTYDGRVYCVEVPNGLIYVRRNGKAVWCGNTYPMLADATWRTALEVWEPLLSRVVENTRRIVLVTGHEILFRSSDDPDRLRGPNAAWAWIDEAALCHPDTWPITIGRLRQFGELGTAWLTTTPRGHNWLYEQFVVGATDETSVHRAATWANPFVDTAFTVSLRSQYSGELARQEIEAEWIADTAGALLEYRWLDAARTRTAAYRPEAGPVVAGLDVAGPGEDETVLVVRQGEAILDVRAFGAADPRGDVLAALRPWRHRGLARVNVDSAGLGHYLARHLEDAGLRVRDINVGEAPTSDTARERYANLKGELYWALRERFADGDIAGLTDQTMLSQLAGLRYEHDSRGRVKIESKDDAQKRGVKSPDRAEALMLAFSPDDPAALRAQLYGLRGGSAR